jgi:hypothetical protein
MVGGKPKICAARRNRGAIEIPVGKRRREMRILSVRKKIENGMLIFYCKRCGKILDATEDLDYAGTDGCEVWEVELNNRHKDHCKPKAEWLEKILSSEDIAKAKELAEIARSFGEVATWEEIAADLT